jgi:hypothetical protein
MAPRRALLDKCLEGPESPEGKPSKARKRASVVTDNDGVAIANVTPTKRRLSAAIPATSCSSKDVKANPAKQEHAIDDQTAVVLPLTRGGGKGIKAVQTKHEQSTISEKTNGTKEESKTKTQEQKLYHAKSNAHLETKTKSDDTRKKVRRDGSVTIITSSRTKTVSYF